MLPEINRTLLWGVAIGLVLAYAFWKWQASQKPEG